MYSYSYITTFTGQPIAWLISDREDHNVITVFLKSIKERSSETKVATLMTDDGK